VLARSHWSILVRSIDRHDLLFAHHPCNLVMPASNMKILTMAAAAERLGWGYRFETTLETAAPVHAGILQGDLLVRGGGDPSIALRDDVAARTFDEWAEQLASAGIHRIEGRILGDDGAFEDEELGAGWAWDDLAYGYSAPSSALVYNESLVRITLRPGGAPGDSAAMDVAPARDHGLAIVNRVTTGAPEAELSLDVRRERGSSRLVIEGVVPAGVEDPATFTAAVDNPTIFFARSLASALLARGFGVAGRAADCDALAPDDRACLQTTRVVARHLSAPLSELGRTFMKVSQNLYGELFVKAVGRAAGEGTAERGHEAIRQTLDSWGVPPDSYILADGSGLSRLNYVSAEAVVAVLERVYADATHRGAFLQALPIGGRDGTLRNRLRASWTEGRVHAKTGSISNARALSGYLTTRSGEHLVFSIVANNYSVPGWRIEGVIDLLVEILARQ
jgi:D-alanyl-D-alanine carboxypeptidase/D-alanyl-D-alanine-endopeptidase (penicillin-binding protein 4)